MHLTFKLDMDGLAGNQAQELAVHPSPRHLEKNRSFLDVHAVAAVVGPNMKKSKSSTVCNMLSVQDSLRSVQEHENELAELVVVCEPEQSSMMMGGLHPRGALYERPINIDTAKAQHAEFRHQVCPVRALTNLSTSLGCTGAHTLRDAVPLEPRST